MDIDSHMRHQRTTLLVLLKCTFFVADLCRRPADKSWPISSSEHMFFTGFEFPKLTIAPGRGETCQNFHGFLICSPYGFVIVHFYTFMIASIICLCFKHKHNCDVHKTFRKMSAFNIFWSISRPDVSVLDHRQCGYACDIQHTKYRWAGYQLWNKMSFVPVFLVFFSINTYLPIYSKTNTVKVKELTSHIFESRHSWYQSHLCR